MRYARRQSYKRSTRTSRRRSKIKAKMSRKYNTRGQRVYRFKRFTGTFGSLAISNIADTLTGYNFSLSDLPNSSEFTNLFDMYKINAIKISFVPQVTENISSGSLNNPYASSRFFSCIDYNDSAAPTNIDAIRQYANCKYTPIHKVHTRYIYKPKILDTTGFTISPWISTASSSINYFGLKVGVEAMYSTTTTSMVYSVEAKFYMSFKNVV